MSDTQRTDKKFWALKHADLEKLERENQQLRTELVEVKLKCAGVLKVYEEREQLHADLKQCAEALDSDLDSLRVLVAFAHAHNHIDPQSRHSINITKEALSLPSIQAALKDNKSTVTTKEPTT